MDDRTLFRIGAIGAVVAAICCATPLLVVLLAAVGIAGVAWLDSVLLPALAAFIALMVYASIRQRRRSAEPR